jgi:hypothetical protein
VFTYYHRQGAPAIPLTYRPVSEAAVDQQMTPMLARYTRLFVLYYGEHESDPQGLYERWLGTHAYEADEQWIGHLRLALYATRATHPVSQVLAQPATFGGVSLLTAEVEQGPAVVGDLLTLRLTWRADAKLSARYKVFVHLGVPDAPPVAQNDAEPQAGYKPTDAWNPGEAVDDLRAVWVKPGTPPGAYGLYVGLYDSATGQRLPVSAPDGRARGDRLWLGDVTLGTP